MSVTHVVGVDPGLVHTGVVRFIFDADAKTVTVEHKVIYGRDAAGDPRQTTDIAADVRRTATARGDWPVVFIEKYQPRSNLNTDARMTELLAMLKQRVPSAQVLLNTGVKKVVRKHLMELLGVWSFSTVTNHQDLRSAARIALYGMLKDEAMNRLLSDVVSDHLDGETWDVRH